MRNRFEDFYENHGCGWLIFLIIITLGLAFGIYELEPETPLDYEDDECWGWEATAWWNRIEVID